MRHHFALPMLATAVNVGGIKLVSFLGLLYLVVEVIHQKIDDIRLLGKLFSSSLDLPIRNIHLRLR